MSKHASVPNGRRAWVIGSAICVGLTLLASTLYSVAGASTSTPSSPPPLRAKPAAGVRPAVAATNVHCGQTLTASVTLNGDLDCPGTALTITGANVVLNLGGHVLGGSNSGYGIRVLGKSDTVENGLVSEFTLGLEVAGTTDTISAIRLSYIGGTSIYDHGAGTKITNCFVAFSGTDGIVFGGSAAVYSGNHIVNSGGNGMILEGSNASVTGTVSNANVGAGINDLGSGTKLTKNSADYNGFDGIYSRDATLVDGGGNVAKNNAPSAGETVAVQCRGVVCG